MNNNKPSTLLAYFFCFFALSSTAAHSADTDIFLNQSSTVLPNVVFSMDTSGSMNDELSGHDMNSTWYVESCSWSWWSWSWTCTTTPGTPFVGAPPEYDPGTTYAGPFTGDNFYTSSDGRVPTAPDGVSNAPLLSLVSCDYAQSPLAADGFTSVRAALSFASSSSVSLPKSRWLPGSQAKFDISTPAHLSVECGDDSGTHGEDAASTDRYANSNSGSGPLYTNDSSREIDWDKYPYVTIFKGNYLNYKSAPPTDIPTSRKDLQNRVIRDAIKRTPNIMAGLARLYGTRGGAIIRGVQDNSVRANQNDLLDTLHATTYDAWGNPRDYAGGTPLSTALLEIMHYFHGKTINRTADYLHGSPRSSQSGYGPLPTDPAARSGGTYNSPIISECQKNYVIMVTDGVPMSDTGAETDFRSSNSLYPNYSTHTGEVSTCAENCLDEVAAYMSKEDAAPSLDNIYDLDGDGTADPQTIKTFPIGMATNQPLLNNAAAAAGTTSYYATDASEFENAFVDILAKISANQPVSMTTAISSNNRFSKTSNREFLYYGQFLPSNKAQWRGNLKKYRYAYNSDGVAYITDSDETNNPDITTANGGTISSAKSYWSPSIDGNNALQGGVVSKLKARSPFGRLIRGINVPGDTGVPIMTAANQLDTSDPAYITGVNASTRTAAEQNRILWHAIGQDVHDEDRDGDTTEQRGTMGALVRSSPVALQYGGTPANPDIVIFATTTDGVLHAFDDATGDELWAIVMPEAYPHLAEQYDNGFSTSPWWGVDGVIAPRVIDNNANGIIEEADGDKVYLYISGGMSMRRWFILDVTRAMETSNQAMLVKRGKHDASSASWDELGIAITQMVPLTYRLAADAAGVKRQGMLYANGWDPLAEFSYGDSTMGRGLSLYNADNLGPPGAPDIGDLLWHKTRGDMKYAFATEPTTVDLNGDGYTDLIYAVDVNAQIWRFNVKQNATNASSLITGGKLVTLGNDSDGNRRRTYKRIDASVVNTATKRQVLLAIGTGDRMSPLSDTDNDRLYVIQDKTASSGANPTSVLTESNLYDATLNEIGEGSTAIKDAALLDLSTKSGWYIRLPAGAEKAISAPLISSGIVNFPVYQTGGAATNPCENNSLGTALLYRMHVLDATPAADYDGNGTLTKGDRFTHIRGGGIPGDVGFHTSPTGIKTIIVNRDPFVNNPDPMAPSLNASPAINFQGDAAGYWFE